MDGFSHTCRKFGLVISLTKTNVRSQDVPSRIEIRIGNQELEVTDHLTYLGLTMTYNLSVDAELDKRIAKAAAAVAQLSKGVWTNTQLTLNSKLNVYQACVLSSLLYGSGSWTIYARQENCLESFHIRYLRRILGIKWQDRVTTSLSACISCSASVCDVSVTYIGWTMGAYPKASCMVN
ncbi:hypothetical protein RRG08_031238 [Elysia crispata]|uniref:Reverse transcriptase n=1 Tax=Elysia crispata TaxID=231223 RepID=A0AAE1DZL8_9GAST|nr:hypothetical protein RRG08_031238 [Elysia crispata]